MSEMTKDRLIEMGRAVSEVSPYLGAAVCSNPRGGGYHLHIIDLLVGEEVAYADSDGDWKWQLGMSPIAMLEDDHPLLPYSPQDLHREIAELLHVNGWKLSPVN